MHFDVLITFIFSSLVLTISPGPDIIYVISQSLVKGKKAAIITSLGLTTGLLFHTFFVVIGFSPGIIGTLIPSFSHISLNSKNFLLMSRK